MLASLPVVNQRLRWRAVIGARRQIELCHAQQDVAQSFMGAMSNRSVSVGEAFHVVSPAALTLRGYAESVARWSGHAANLKFLPWEEWRKTVSDEHAAQTWDHIAHSPNASIAKAQRLLDYRPCYSSLLAIYESVQWLIRQGVVQA